MSVNGGVTCSSGEVLALSVGDVFSVSLDVALGKSEVDEEDLVCSFVESHTEVVGFDVSVDEVPVVHVLDPRYHLIHEHQYSL